MPKPHSLNRPNDISRFSPEILDASFDTSPTAHDDLWRSIQPDEAALVRRAVVKAQEIRANETDPGDAYLQGIAAALYASRHSGRDDNGAESNAERERLPLLRLILSDGPDVDASTS